MNKILNLEFNEANMRKGLSMAGFDVYNMDTDKVFEIVMERLIYYGLDSYKSVTRQVCKPIHTQYRGAKTGTLIHKAWCSNCGIYNQRIVLGTKFCPNCGYLIDWDDPIIERN